MNVSEAILVITVLLLNWQKVNGIGRRWVKNPAFTKLGFSAFLRK